jgi:hydrogenase/urease accessory protein HupE
LPAIGLSAGASNKSHSFFAFLRLGVEHILTGYDHLLFLFALMVVCRDLRSIFMVITFFTVAHSITLALATLDIVRLPGRIVEPTIAATIAYVGIENLVHGDAPKWRGLITFLFGLVHGLGFADANLKSAPAASVLCCRSSASTLVSRLVNFQWRQLCFPFFGNSEKIRHSCASGSPFALSLWHWPEAIG